MNSYQKLKNKNKQLENDVELLRNQLANKASLFFKSQEWLGMGRRLYGVVYKDGSYEILTQEKETEMNPKIK